MTSLQRESWLKAAGGIGDHCFLRRAGNPGTDYDPQYIRNGRRALDRFAAYLLQPENVGGEELIEACAAMHRLFSLGESGAESYRRLDRDRTLAETGQYTLDATPPGEFRRELAKPPYSIRPDATEYAERINRTVLGNEESLAAEPLRMPGLHAEAWPLNRDYYYSRYGKTARVHFYPAAHHIPAYFAAAAPILDSARTAQAGCRDALRAIAVYYYLMINARPYGMLNNGLFMGQVNVLLVLHGFEPVCHGALDHLAHRFQVGPFEFLFRQHLVGKLPMGGIE